MNDPLVLIPARLDSTRLHHKVLQDINGLTMLERTYMTALEVSRESYVATGDPEIIEHCQNRGMRYIRTAVHYPNGTARCAAAAVMVLNPGDENVVVNLQADEVDLCASELETLIRHASHTHNITTLIFPLEGDRSAQTTKAVLGRRNRCLWFSRGQMASAQYGHVGVYAFPDITVLKAVSEDPTPVSELESLEQLSWLDRDWTIEGIKLERAPLSVNTEQDLQLARELIK